MHRQKRRLVTVAAVLGYVLLCGPSMGQQGQKPLTNLDVVKMIKAGLPASIIVSSIQSTPSNFDVSPNALIALHKAGVTKAILEAMMAAQSKQASSAGAPATAGNPPASSSPAEASPPAGDSAAAPPASSPPAPSPGTATPAAASPASATPAVSPAAANAAPSGLPAVTFVHGDAVQPIPIERTQLEETKTKPSSMTSLASDSALTPVVVGEVGVATAQVASHVHSGFGSASLGQAGGLFSGVMARRKPDQTYVWAVPNPASSNVLPTTLPAFTVDFSSVPGVNSAEYEPEIVHLTPSQNSWRLVGATRGKSDATSSSAASWQVYADFLEDQVAIHSQKTAAGQFRITPAAPLLPGEYGVVLRPVSRDKKFSGADVARDQGDGMAFDSVWSFQVPPDAKAP